MRGRAGAKFGGPTPDARCSKPPPTGTNCPPAASEATDGATPGGTALAASALQTLSLITGRRDFSERAVRLLSGLSGVMKSQPMQAGWALLALARHLGPPTQVVLAGEADGVKELRRAYFGTFAPHAVLIDATADCGGVDPDLLAGKEAAGRRGGGVRLRARHLRAADRGAGRPAGPAATGGRGRPVTSRPAGPP